MHYMLLIHASETRWSKMTAEEQQRGVAAYNAYTEALKSAGVWVSSNRLGPSSATTTVHVDNGSQHVLDGPFVDSKEQLAGYYMIDVPDLDAAISWAARCPGASHGSIEVRPLWNESA